MDKSLYIKWYNLAGDIVKDESLIPKRTDAEILSFVSGNGWLMISSLDSIDEGKNSELPNIYFNFKETTASVIGLTFNTVRAVDSLKNLLSEYSKDEKIKLLEELKKLDNVWEIIVYRKIKDKNHAQIPEWKDEFSLSVNKIDSKIIEEIINKVEEIRKEGLEKSRETRELSGKYYFAAPSVDLMVCQIRLNEDNFEKRIIDVFRVYKIFTKVKSSKEIRNLEKDDTRSSQSVKNITTSEVSCQKCGFKARYQFYRCPECNEIKK